jgi:hypothetical protein
VCTIGASCSALALLGAEEQKKSGRRPGRVAKKILPLSTAQLQSAQSARNRPNGFLTPGFEPASTGDQR